MKKIVLTGGGTAGHVTPNIALLPALQAAGYEIAYVGSYEGIETADCFFRLHSFYQSTDSLQITVASTGEFYGINNTIL